MIGLHLGHSLRSLRRTPSPVALSILTIALGVGATTLLFGVVKAVLLNPPPYAAPERLAWISSITGGSEGRTSMPDFDDWQRGTRSFASMALYSEAPLIAGGGETPQHVSGTLVSESFFDVLVCSRHSGARSFPRNTAAARCSRT